jgi:hypothetical protein
MELPFFFLLYWFYKKNGSWVFTNCFMHIAMKLRRTQLLWQPTLKQLNTCLGQYGDLLKPSDSMFSEIRDAKKPSLLVKC